MRNNKKKNRKTIKRTKEMKSKENKKTKRERERVNKGEGKRHIKAMNLWQRK